MAVSRIGATSHQLAVMSLEKLGMKANDMTYLQVGLLQSIKKENR